MTACTVICNQCVDDTGRARRWDQNCEDCAQDCLKQHRRQTGHADMELRVTREESFTYSATRGYAAARRLRII